MRVLGTKYVDQHEKTNRVNQLIKLVSRKKRTLQLDLGGNFLLRCRDVKDRQLTSISVQWATATQQSFMLSRNRSSINTQKPKKFP